MGHLRPFVCERCGAIVREVDERRIVSIDATDQNTSHRFARRMLGRFCEGCAGEVLADVVGRYAFGARSEKQDTLTVTERRRYLRGGW